MLSHPLFRMLVTILFLFNSLFPLWYQSAEFWWITMILSIRPLYESVKVEVKRCEDVEKNDDWNIKYLKENFQQ